MRELRVSPSVLSSAWLRGAVSLAVLAQCRPVSEPPTPESAVALPTQPTEDRPVLQLGEREYFAMPGLEVMVGSDFYPEGHQGGVSVIQNGLRTAANGDLRLEPTPGQWQPVPKLNERVVDTEQGEIRLRLSYPDPEKHQKGFNPIEYPDLELSYTVRVRPDGASFRVYVDLDEPLPQAWVGKVGFNLELFPGRLYGKAFHSDQGQGLFPRQANGPQIQRDDGSQGLAPLARGGRLVVAPEDESLRMVIEAIAGDPIELYDGRDQHNNGWFIVRSTLPAGATSRALEWKVTPHAIPGWVREPALQVSQVGYHPRQPKHAVVELDPKAAILEDVELIRLDAENPGAEEVVLRGAGRDMEWGHFLRYRYLRFDFSSVTTPGLYQVKYGETRTHAFQIHPDVYRAHVWQPTLETFLPVQMCHMRVNDRYRVWHDACHLDDARMAPTDLNHFDGYVQGPSTLTRYASGAHVPHLDRGGWHDAGDHDLRVESQADTVYGLALAYESFGLTYDNTSIDQEHRVVELQRPDGQPDALQQIEHGLLSIVGGYRAMGRLYRGIITPTLRQYVLLGDPAAGTDNQVFQTRANPPPVGLPGGPDDNWVFTEENPGRELSVAAALAAGARVLREFNPSLSKESLAAAKALWKDTKGGTDLERVAGAVELLLTTGDAQYLEFLVKNQSVIADNFAKVGWIVGRSLTKVEDPSYRDALFAAARKHHQDVELAARKSPYGIPYEPNIWGAGWSIQRFGAEQYYLHASFPEVFPPDYALDALNFVLGCHPGSNTVSFASGVGANSLTVAYGINRGDESYIPGGIGSGTALIRPDYPELLEWPYLWQQTEYVLGYGTTDYLTLVLGADRILRGGQ